MGNASAKLRRQLQRGEEYACLELCEKHAEFRKSLDPNLSYGEPFGHNTPLHYACKHSMRALIRLFLIDLNGNPNKRNSDEQTSLHLCCQGGTRMSRHLDDKIRSDCVRMLLAWKSAVSDERILINAVDNRQNTALHYAASSGLMKCVELLVAASANMSVANEHKDTACDAAERAGNTAIAELLEMRTVFATIEDTSDEKGPSDPETSTTEVFTGLREQELIEAKDLLLVETSDMLQVPLFTAEALLSYHDWSREQLWLSWHLDAVACCERSGVLAPASARECTNKLQRLKEPSSVASIAGSSKQPLTCGICLDTVNHLNDMMLNSECEHMFCHNCWKEYVTLKIKSGQAHHISCAAHGCQRLLPATLIQAVVEPELARKYITAEIQAFVDGNPKLKWCPHAGCNNAVQMVQPRQTAMYLRAFPNMQPPPATSSTVFCPAKHGFCWDCLGEGHEPTSCDKWRQWHDKIAAVKPEELRDAAAGSEAAANCLWLVTHSKPCPKCQSPIQKNEGCNHIKCTKCKHDFCWVCLGHWKKHGVETGGYFRCNRYDDTRKVDEKTEAAIAEAKQQTKRIQEMNKFVHYYSRYRNHLNSYEMELALRGKIAEKMRTFARLARTKSSQSAANARQASVDSALPPQHHQHFKSGSTSDYVDAIQVDSPDSSTSSTRLSKTVQFSVVVDALEELLRSRKVLSSSYAYGYFLKDCGYNKTVFEHLQNKLEVCVESLSYLVGGTYVRGSCHSIHAAMVSVRHKRHEFVTCIDSSLVPPSTAESRSRWSSTSLLASSSQPSGPSTSYDRSSLGLSDWSMKQTISNADSHLKYSRQQYNLDLMIAIQLSRLQMLKDLKLLCAVSDDEHAGDSRASAMSMTACSEATKQLACNAQLHDLDFDQSIQMAIERSLQLNVATDQNDTTAECQVINDASDEEQQSSSVKAVAEVADGISNKESSDHVDEGQ